jgi:hypothetical protein
MGAMQPPQGMAGGGQLSVKKIKAELASKKNQSQEDDDDGEKAPSKRILIKGEGPGGVTGIVVPHHMWHGRSWISSKTGKLVTVPGMLEINKARAQVYGSEHRPPLTIGAIGKIHRATMDEHFSKPLKDQIAAEKEAIQRLRAAQHLGATANTLDESEKLDTVRHEYDDEGRPYAGYAAKGVAGHALYTSGVGKDAKHYILNTCPGQTEGCGGGKDENGVVDTSKGTCFAPNAESQYVHAAVRRACHEQAKHDPAMTRDWILAHAGSMRAAANKEDRNNHRVLFRPNVVDETDVSSNDLIGHLNKQRANEGKPEIISNSYGKTGNLHDPENGIFITHSNVGPKVKNGKQVKENIGRDEARVRETIMAASKTGEDYVNKQGNRTPPKGTYLVTDVKRGSKLSKDMEGAITHAKYWSSGKPINRLSEAERNEGPEGHFDANGNPTDEQNAHYGHRIINGLRFDYQRQHVLHPRLVNVPVRKKNKKTGEMETVAHMIPTDSRFKDVEYLPKQRYKTKNGKDAGHILMTTPTESTSNLGHETSFTHHVGQNHIEHALQNNGEYEIDRPEDQIKANGKEYAAPQAIRLKLADGGRVHCRHHGYGEDDFLAFPERNVAAQRHLAMRRGDDEDHIEIPKYAHGGSVTKYKHKVLILSDLDTMKLELIMNKKAK